MNNDQINMWIWWYQDIPVCFSFACRQNHNCFLFIYNFSQCPFSLYDISILPVTKAHLFYFIFFFCQGRAIIQSLNTANHTVKFSVFGEIAGVSTSRVQWVSLTLRKPPSWIRYLPCQWSMRLLILESPFNSF